MTKDDWNEFREIELNIAGNFGNSSLLEIRANIADIMELHREFLDEAMLARIMTTVFKIGKTVGKQELQKQISWM